jgi:hypothetical protein
MAKTVADLRDIFLGKVLLQKKRAEVSFMD